jgi:hypothetical protein
MTCIQRMPAGPENLLAVTDLIGKEVRKILSGRRIELPACSLPAQQGLYTGAEYMRDLQPGSLLGRPSAGGGSSWPGFVMLQASQVGHDLPHAGILYALARAWSSEIAPCSDEACQAVRHLV